MCTAVAADPPSEAGDDLMAYFRNVHRLRDTLGEMVRRLKDDPEGWYRRNKLAFPGERASAA